MSKKTMLAAAAIAAMALSARAELIVDQEFTAITVDGAINARSRLAQTVTAGMSGPLEEIQLAVACQATAGNVTVEIVDLDGDLPGSTVLASSTLTPADLPPSSPLDFRAFLLNRQVRMEAGHRFAIVITFENGPCTLGMGDGYAGGHGYFDSVTFGWFRIQGPAWEPDDIAFRTRVDEPRGETACSVRGFGDLFFGRSVPVCRCLQDPSLRELRCGLIHPSMFLFRRIPFPIRAGQPFTVKWTLVALAPMKGVVELNEVLPKGFDGMKLPLTFFVDKLQAGESITLEYKALAPKGGKFKVDTFVGSGQMQTMLEVDPK